MGRGLDGFFSAPLGQVVTVCAPEGVCGICVVLKDRGISVPCAVRGGLSSFSGGFSEGETPLPIPNRAVKPLSADGTWPARARESRTPPVSS